MQGARKKRCEFCIPYGGITRIRFIGTLSIRSNAGYPRNFLLQKYKKKPFK